MMNLADLLDDIGWSNGDLARRLDISPDTVSKWAKGRRDPPQPVMDWLGQLATCHARAGPHPKGWFDGPEFTEKPGP
jgi:transcriptional regulator with XRE-family HTH domain